MAITDVLVIQITPPGAPTTVIETVGKPGTPGNTGWSAVFAVMPRVVPDDEKVLQLVDWVGGTGTKPLATIGKYVGVAGLVVAIADAIGIRGNATDGADGASIHVGAGIPGAGLGNIGDLYVDLSTFTLYHKTGIATWTSDGSFKGTDGAPGINGVDGATIRWGSGVPGPGLGADGDQYTDTASGDVYGKAAGAWSLLFNSKGPQGVAGSKLFTGAIDPTGAVGVDGDSYINTVSQHLWTRAAGVWTDQGTIRGLPGGSSSVWEYRTKTTIITGDPLNTFLIWNNATQINATQINFSHINFDTVDIEVFWTAWVAGVPIIIQDRDVSENFQNWEISGAPTLQVGYIEVPVTLVSSGGTGTTNFPNGHPVIVAYQVPGPQGPPGTNGTKVIFGAIDPTGAVGVNGDSYINTVSQHLWTKAAGAWTDTGTLKGNDGAPGADGIDAINAADALIYLPGKQVTASQIMARIRVVRAFTWPASLTGSLADAAVASTGTPVFTIKNNGADIGTITYTTSATGVLSFASLVNFAIGDIITIVGPASPDATLSDMSWSFLGNR